jgi:hypothetical protein
MPGIFSINNYEQRTCLLKWWLTTKLYKTEELKNGMIRAENLCVKIIPHPD